MAKHAMLDVNSHSLLRVLDTLDRNGPLTFSEICDTADITELAVNNELYIEDDLGAPYNHERAAGQLYRISKLGRNLIGQLRSWVEAPRTLPERPTPTAEIGKVYVRTIGDEEGFYSEPAGSQCTVKSHKDGMIWYIYDDQKKRWGRCSKPFCMDQDQFDLEFVAVE
jgi:hypothetical protein